jgi:hypothetical protein
MYCYKLKEVTNHFYFLSANAKNSNIVKKYDNDITIMPFYTYLMALK